MRVRKRPLISDLSPGEPAAGRVRIRKSHLISDVSPARHAGRLVDPVMFEGVSEAIGALGAEEQAQPRAGQGALEGDGGRHASNLSLL